MGFKMVNPLVTRIETLKIEQSYVSSANALGLVFTTRTMSNFLYGQYRNKETRPFCPLSPPQLSII